MDNFFKRNKKPLAFGFGLKTENGIELYGVYIGCNFKIAAILMEKYQVKEQDSTSIIYPEENIYTIVRNVFTKENFDLMRANYGNLDGISYPKGKLFLVFFFHECPIRKDEDEAVFCFREKLKYASPHI